MLTKREQNLGAVVSALAIALLLLYLSLALLGFGDDLAFLSALGGSLVCGAVISAIVLRRCRKAAQPGTIDYLNVGTQRYILGMFMLMYGIDKLLGNFFDYQLFALDSKMAEVSEFQLAWFFYGKSRWQELFTGIMEFVPGIFLLHRRSYYIAALVLLPVTAQVFFLNLFFKIGGITFPVSAVLLACNLYIVYSQKEQILRFFRSLNLRPEGALGRRARRSVRVFRTAGFVLVALLLFVKLRPVLFRSDYQRMYRRLVGIYELKSMKRNGLAYQPVLDSSYYKDLYIEKQARWNILRKFNNETEAFILRLRPGSDSLALFLNRGGTGDGADIIDSASALRGVYRLDGRQLRIRGRQQQDSLELIYERQDRVLPKSWWWE